MRCGEDIADNPGHLQWSIFFFARTDIDIGLFEERIKAHPFVAKAERHNAKDDLGNIGDHLSPWDVKLYTRRNSSVLMGYTKHGDGQPRPEGQMTHLWMKLTKGNKSEDPAVREHNLQLIANLLCEIARFELPYPLALGVERVGPLLRSAVGDSIGTKATAVGVASAGTVGRPGESSRWADEPINDEPPPGVPAPIQESTTAIRRAPDANIDASAARLADANRPPASTAISSSAPSRRHDDRQADARPKADVVVVKLHRTAGRPVGMGYHKGGTQDMEVGFVQEGHLLDAWNKANPDRASAAGDNIVQVDGKTG